MHTHQMFVRTKDVLTEIEYELNKAHAKFYHPQISAYIFSQYFVLSVKVKH